MRHKLEVDGTDLSTFGVYVSGDGTFSGAEKQYTFYDAPQRNGSILSKSYQFADINVSYKCFIYDNFRLDTIQPWYGNMAMLRSFLMSRNGLVKIKDNYHPAEYRLGVYQGPLEPDVKPDLKAGSFTLTFRCKPQRYFITGDIFTECEMTGSDVAYPFTNPTKFASLPTFRVYGYGRFRVTHTTIDYVDIAQHDKPFIVIDGETMSCHYGDTDMSAYVSFSDNNGAWADPPKFLPGGNNVRLYANQNITEVDVWPRWWTA